MDDACSLHKNHKFIVGEKKRQKKREKKEKKGKKEEKCQWSPTKMKNLAQR